MLDFFLSSWSKKIVNMFDSSSHCRDSLFGYSQLEKNIFKKYLD